MVGLTTEEKIENLNIAIDYIIKAIEILEVVKNTKNLSMAYFYRGLFFERRNLFEEVSTSPSGPIHKILFLFSSSSVFISKKVNNLSDQIK